MKRFLFTIALALGLFACANTQDFQKNVNVAQATNTSLVQLVGVGAQTGKLKKADAQNLLNQIDLAQQGIEVANSLPADQATSRLAQATAVFASIQDYLLKQGVK